MRRALSSTRPPPKVISMKRHRLSVLLALAVLVTPPTRTSAQSQIIPELFVPLNAPAASAVLDSRPAGRAISDRQAVAMRLHELFAGPDGAASRVVLNLEDQTWVATFERLEQDALGFRSWIGSLDSVPYSHVVFTERQGIVSGLINAVGTTYQVRTLRPGAYVIERVELSGLPSDHGVAPAPQVAVAAADRSERSITASSEVMAGDDGTTIDVLILYTPTAKAAAGGDAQIQAIASQVIADGNTILTRSGTNPRLRLVMANEFQFTESNDEAVDEVYFRNSAARASRDAANADVVQLLVSSPGSLRCGHAFPLDSIGFASPLFDAYSVADIECLAQYGPPHEIFHNLGATHEISDQSLAGAFPYSHAYKDAANGFRTVMAGECAGTSCPRIANLSSPLVFHNGAVTGTVSADNARTVNETASKVANLRQSSGSAGPPASPTNLRVQVSGSDVTLLWDAVVGATGYTLEIGSSPGVYNLLNTPVGRVTSTTLSLGVGNYYWRVSSSNTAGVGVPAPEVQFAVTSTCAIPSAPLNLVASVFGAQVFLSWQPPLTGRVTTYVVEAGSASGLSDRYNLRTGSAQPQISGQIPGGTYYIRVRAENACGVSQTSPEVVVSIGSGPLAPTDLTLRLEGGFVHVAWNVPTGTQHVVDFLIEAGSAPGLANLALFATPRTSLTVVKPPPGVYYVRVRARGFSGVGPASPDAILIVQ